MLDEVVNLSMVSPKQWEEALNRKLWEKMAAYVFEKIYLPAAQSGSAGELAAATGTGLLSLTYHSLNPWPLVGDPLPSTVLCLSH